MPEQKRRNEKNGWKAASAAIVCVEGVTSSTCSSGGQEPQVPHQPTYVSKFNENHEQLLLKEKFWLLSPFVFRKVAEVCV